MALSANSVPAWMWDDDRMLVTLFDLLEDAKDKRGG